MSFTSELRNKLDQLKQRLAGYGRLAVAFSGGVDSALLLKAAAEALPLPDLLAMTARAEIFPAWEAAEASCLARDLGVTQLILDFQALQTPQVAANPPDRCYYCKKTLFQGLLAEAGQRGFTVLADGGNLDDDQDFRPGTRAARELGVVSPLKEAGLTKADVRQLSKHLGLPTWDKPAYACLASRFPYGQPLTLEKLTQVERAEDFLRGLGFREVRVRHHGQVARVEVGVEERRRFFDLDMMDKVHQALRDCGFTYAALDLAGYRGGGLNEAVPAEELEKYK